MSTQYRPLTILAVGLTAKNLHRLKVFLSKPVIKVIESSDRFAEIIDQVNPETADLILCGSDIKEIIPLELAQSLKMQASGVPIYFVGADGERINDLDMIKNGFDELFLMPFDEQLLRSLLQKLEQTISGMSKSEFVPIPILDLESEQPLDFEVAVYLPANEKFVKMNRAGRAISAEQRQRLEKNNVRQLFIDERQLDHYHAYSAQRISELQSQARQSLADQEKLERSVRQIFKGLLSTTEGDFESGKGVIESSQKIVQQLVGSPEMFNLRAQLEAHTGGLAGDAYERSVRISTYAALFALVTNACMVQDAALAAMFIDIGLGDIPLSTHDKPWSELSEEERQQLAMHPERGLRVLKEKRVALSNTIQDAILQHHERVDGKGYPKGYADNRISPTAKIVTLAAVFDDLTILKPGRPRENPADIFSKIALAGQVSCDYSLKLRKVLAAA